MDKVLISGASGFIGQHLVKILAKNSFDVYTLVRRKPMRDNEIFWNPAEGELTIPEELAFFAVIHLSGQNVAGYWNRSYKDKILNSRVSSTETLVRAFSSNPPKVWIQSSGASLYPESGPGSDVVDSKQYDRGYLSEVVQKWEAAASEMKPLVERLVYLRTPMVLAKKGGALEKMNIPFKLGLGFPLGSGDQRMEWISIDDFLHAVLWIMHTESISGPVNMCSPNPESHLAFCKMLAASQSRPCWPALPRFLIPPIFSEMLRELSLRSYMAPPEKLLESGYKFKEPNLRQYFQKLFS
jgi:hypothetical protein